MCVILGKIQSKGRIFAFSWFFSTHAVCFVSGPSPGEEAQGGRARGGEGTRHEGRRRHRPETEGRGGVEGAEGILWGWGSPLGYCHPFLFCLIFTHTLSQLSPSSAF